jgi:ribonuclease HI
MPSIRKNSDAHLSHVTIYTDGACSPNPGPGGWAAVLWFGEHKKILTGSETLTTNNRMELTAAIRALQALERPSLVELYTDSEYLRRGVTEWLPRWRARQWRRKGGSLANLDLWQTLDSLIHQHEVTWHWVRGHSDDPNNLLVDTLARHAIPKNKC